jgi:hypothetical protein
MKNKIVVSVMSVLMFVLPVLATQDYPLTTPINSVIAATFPTPDSGTVAATIQDGKTVTEDHASYKQHTFESVTKDGKADFVIAYFDYSTVRGTDVATLDHAVDGGISAMNMVLVPGSRENSTFNSIFAREAHAVSDNQESYLIVSTYGYRAYIGVVVFDRSLHATEQDANEFFKTLRLGN